MTLAETLLANARDDGGCLIWLGACCNKHPAHRVDGKTRLVRRTLFTDLVGPIEPGKIIRATCETPKCIQPEHLEKTTYRRLAKELGARGVMSGPKRSAKIAAAKRAGTQAKLTQADVARIRHGNETGVQLARELGVNERTVSKIRRGLVWRDFSSPWAGLVAA